MAVMVLVYVIPPAKKIPVELVLVLVLVLELVLVDAEFFSPRRRRAEIGIGQLWQRKAVGSRTEQPAMKAGSHHLAFRSRTGREVPLPGRRDPPPF